MAEPSDTLSGQESTTAGSPDAQTTIKSLAEKAAQKYVRKDYAAASDLYAQATELQVKLHGEMALSSAEFYFLYGRSLYHLAVSTSDVLGAKPGGNADSTGPPKKKVSSGNGPTGTVALKGDQDVKKAVSEEVAERVNVSNGDGDGQAPAAAKPYFQFAGDENWDNSDEDGDTDEKAEDAENDDPDEEENDFTLAWENLDLARLLFDRKVQELQNSKDDGKATEDPDEIRHSKERLADAHDLLAEISLEHETYSAAADDFLKSLSLKQELYPTESSVIAEAHYKLSLALEFASIKNTAEDTKETGKNAQVQYDKAGREEAAKHMEAAIHSAKLRVEKEEALLATETTDEETMRRKKRISRESVEEVKEMIADMEQRVSSLHPTSLEPIHSTDMIIYSSVD